MSCYSMGGEPSAQRQHGHRDKDGADVQRQPAALRVSARHVSPAAM